MKNKKLSNEEIKNLLKLWQEEHDQQAAETLILKNMGLVKYFVNRYYNGSLSHDELKSAGLEGLIRALNKFDLNKSIEAFSTYIATSIDNQIKGEIIKYKKHDKVISFDQPLGYNKNGDEMTVEDIIGSDEEQLFNEVILNFKTAFLKDVLEGLTFRERQIILLRYGLDEKSQKSQEEIARLFDCSAATVSKDEKKALLKMRHPRNTKMIKDFID